MQKGLIGKKIGMTQLFDEQGNVVPVTVIEAGPCPVVQKKTVENDGYEAVQLGFSGCQGSARQQAHEGPFREGQCRSEKVLREFRLADISAMNVGDILKADVFAAGDHIDVVGTSKGKGTAGAIKRSELFSPPEKSPTVPARSQGMPVRSARAAIPPAYSKARSLRAIWARNVSQSRI